MSSSKFYEKLKYELKKKDEKIDELTSMIDSLPGTVYWKDKLGRYVNCNSRMADIFGLDKSEVIGHADHNILSSGQASLLQANDQAVMLSANESGAVFLEKHLGGEGQYFLSHKKNWVGAENKIKGVCGQSLLFDVHKQEMDELRKVKQDLEDQINIKVSFIQNLVV